jgi:hypothetical protein
LRYQPDQGEVLMVDISREEIEVIKLVRLMRQPTVSARLRMIRGTQTLLWVRRILRWCNLAFILSIPVAFVFISPWWWVLAVAVLLFILINLIQGELNLELGARVLAVNRKMKLT